MLLFTPEKIRTSILSLLVICMFSKAQAQCPTLIWSDEFDQPGGLNTADWTYATGGGGYGNNELQNYTSRPENIKLEDGKLIITALEEDYGAEHYTSAKIYTPGKQFFTYGRMEAKIKLPKTQGLWPAFWMMPNTSFYGGWPRSGEIDIMEMKGSNVYSTYGTIHYGTDAGAGHKYKGGSYSSTNDLSEDFHIYAVEWKPDTINWFFDDINFYTVTKTSLGSDNWPFDKDFYFILNLAVGGNFGGDPNATTVFPQTMEVEYVRAYSNPNTLVVSGASKVIEGQTYSYHITNGVADSYLWTVPSDATILSGQGNDTITVQWGASSGNVSVDVVRGVCGSSSYYLGVNVIPNSCNLVFNDFETNTLLSYSPSSTGVLYNATEDNPSANTVNSSTKVALYQRNIFELYDVLKYDVNFLPTSADYENGHNVLYMDVYTTAPVGTAITWQFENKAKATLNYPTGRRSIFRATTKKQNEWERVKFTYQSIPDYGTSPAEIDQVTILFKPNTYTDHVYYIDNIFRRDASNCGVLSVQDELESSFVISPNPANDVISFSLQGIPAGSMEITIVDVIGKEHMKQLITIASSSQQEIMDVSKLEPGVYILYAKREGETILSRKIIVK